jgi:hypothetical protein
MIGLHEHLMSLNAELLKGWARRMDLAAKGLTRKDQFSELSEKELKERLPAVLERLSLAERQFLAECVHRGQVISATAFQAKYGVVCPQPSRHYSYRSEVELLTPFIARDTSFGNCEESGIVKDLVEPLRALLPPPPGVQARTAGPIPATWKNDNSYHGGRSERRVHTFEGERIGVAELDRVLRLIQGGKVKVTDSTRRPTDGTARLVEGVLVEPDLALEEPEEERKTEFEKKYYRAAGPVRAHAWPVVVQQCGWAKAKAGALTLTEEGKELLRQFDAQKFRAGVARLLDDSDFDELHRINHIRGQTGKSKRWITPPSERKEAILLAMASFPIGQWLTFEEARRLIEASGERWGVVDGDAGFLYFFEPQYGLIYNGPGLRSQYLRAFLMETLAALGLADVAYVYPHHRWPDLHDSLNGDLPFCGRYDGLLYVRLNPLGAYTLGLSETYEMRPPERAKLFQVLPNLDLVLDGRPLNPADRAGLGLLAAPQSDAVWRLDAERILTHVETGGSFASLRSFLNDNAASGVPENVRVFLDGLEAKLGACCSRRKAVLLEWADPTVAQLITTTSGLKRLCCYAGENRLVVPAENLTAFTRALKRLGYVLPGETH